ncbi:MAG TPA: hypothetical protein VJ870_00990 [Amycolatopsis sp.]|nr:hypothetical protein [Amycolatopsis sp.]
MSTFRILFVCTGNVCRSPVAEILTRQLLREAFGAAATDFAVGSAGTTCADGARMDARTAAALAAYGLGGAADRFRTRRLDADIVADANVVLALEREHRRQVVTLQPAALSTTFCFRELVRLLGAAPRAALPHDPVARARAAVTLAREQRGLHGYRSRDADAIPDPLARPLAEYRTTVELITATANAFVSFLKTPTRKEK